MANTLVTKLKATVSNDSLPLFGAIKIKKKIGSSTFKVIGNNTSQTIPMTLYSPDGTLYSAKTETTAQTITVDASGQSGTGDISFVNDTQYAIIKTASVAGGITMATIVNEIELGNAPLTLLTCNGILHTAKIPATMEQLQWGDSQTDKGEVIGDISEIKSTNLKKFITYADNKALTGSLSELAAKFNATGFIGIGIDNSQIEGNISAFKDLMADSTFSASSIDSTSLTLSVRNASKITGSLDDMLTYLTGKVKSKKVLFSLQGSQCTYNGTVPTTNIYATFDASGDPTIS